MCFTSESQSKFDVSKDPKINRNTNCLVRGERKSQRRRGRDAEEEDWIITHPISTLNAPSGVTRIGGAKVYAAKLATVEQKRRITISR